MVDFYSPLWGKSLLQTVTIVCFVVNLVVITLVDFSRLIAVGIYFSRTLRLSAGPFPFLPGTSCPLGARAHPHLVCLLIIKQTQRDEWSPSQQQGVGGTEPTKAVSLRVKLMLYGRAVAPFPSSDCSGCRQEL